ncbi:MAG: FAD-dependent oxidoreductase [Solirubrobacteraceae bacterium]
MIDRHSHPEQDERFAVLIAGGGVAGLEAAFALRELAGDRVAITVMSDSDDFVYRPLSIGEPFNRSHAEHYGLAGLTAAAGAQLVRGTLAHVDVEQRVARTSDGAEMSYDALVVATGATAEPAFEHATTFDDARIDELLHGLVQDVEEGYTHTMAIVLPAPLPWPFPGYELALMASERAWDMQTDLDITLLTPERMPLEVFGNQVSRSVSELLAERRIKVVTSAYCEIPKSQQVVVHPGGRTFHANRIVALPRLHGPAVDGLTSDGGGFLPVNEFGQVRDASCVWAAGDATDVPIKLGGVAAQLADVVAHSIAEVAGASVQPQPFSPYVEGVLMTGGSPRYLRAQPAWPDPAGQSVFANVPPELSPPKIAAHYLAAHLTRESASIAGGSA